MLKINQVLANMATAIFILTLKQATAAFAEKLGNFQRSAHLITESRSFTTSSHVASKRRGSDISYNLMESIHLFFSTALYM